MSEEIKRLVKRLRAYRPTYGWPEEQATVVRQTLGDEAADALEALVAERDRLKAALVPFAKLETWRGAHDPAEGTMRMRVVTVPEIEAARKALEDKE